MILAAVILLNLLLIGFISVGHAQELKRLQGQLAVEQSRTGDLLTRLAARSLEQYHAVASPPEPAPERDFLYDPTGLVQVDVTDDT